MKCQSLVSGKNKTGHIFQSVICGFGGALLMGTHIMFS